MSEKPCALCGHLKMKEFPEHAKVGVGRCDASAAGRVDVIKPFMHRNKPRASYTPCQPTSTTAERGLRNALSLNGKTMQQNLKRKDDMSDSQEVIQ